MINQLWSNILWGQRSNFVSVPTDCPQRDERLGWTADAQVFWRTASYNMDLDHLLARSTPPTSAAPRSAPPCTASSRPALDTAQPRLRRRLERCRRHHPLDRMDPVRRHHASSTRTGTAWRSTSPRSQANNPDHLWQKNFGTPFGDWLSPERHHPGRPRRHRLLGL